MLKKTAKSVLLVTVETTSPGSWVPFSIFYKCPQTNPLHYCMAYSLTFTSFYFLFLPQGLFLYIHWFSQLLFSMPAAIWTMNHYYQHAKDRQIASPANSGILEDAYSVGGVFSDMMEVKHYFVFFLQLSKD